VNALHVEHVATALAGALAGCVSVSGPCEVVTQQTADGARTASVDCDQGGSVSILAPTHAIQAVEGRASEGAR
jgi:hypothetical protein